MATKKAKKKAAKLPARAWLCPDWADVTSYPQTLKKNFDCSVCSLSKTCTGPVPYVPKNR